MAVRLKVPLVKQLRNMSCWYASACMVAYFRRPGPRLGLPTKWKDNKGITSSDFGRLAEAEGLKAMKQPAGDLTAQQLEVFLRNYGPIWCAGRWDGVPHIVVLTGVDGGDIFINDPAGPKMRRETLAWFNEKLAKDVTRCLMYMPI